MGRQCGPVPSVKGTTPVAREVGRCLGCKLTAWFTKGV